MESIIRSRAVEEVEHSRGKDNMAVSLKAEDSEPMFNSELSLFDIPPTNTAVLNRRYVVYKPIASIGNNGQNTETIEFEIHNSSASSYVDLSKVTLALKVRVLKADGTVPSLEEGSLDVVSASNNFMHSIFRSVEVKLQQQPLPVTLTNYGYKSMLKTLLFMTEDIKKTRQEAVLYTKDTGLVGVATEANDPVTQSNVGLFARFDSVKGGAICQLEGNFLEDFVDIEGYIPNAVPIRFKLTPSRSDFNLIAPTGEYKTVILDASLRVPMVDVSPAILQAHAEAVKQNPFKFFYPRQDIKTFSVATGSYDWSAENIYLGDVPSRLYMVMVASSTYNGDIRQNPYHFHHYHVNYLSLTVDGQEIDGPLQPTFGLGNRLCVREYSRLFTDLEETKSNGLTLTDFADGHTIFKWDVLYQDTETGHTVFPITRRSNVTLSVRFANPTPHPVTILLMGTFQGHFQIDMMRNVLLD